MKTRSNIEIIFEEDEIATIYDMTKLMSRLIRNATIMGDATQLNIYDNDGDFWEYEPDIIHDLGVFMNRLRSGNHVCICSKEVEQ